MKGLSADKSKIGIGPFLGVGVDERTGVDGLHNLAYNLNEIGPFRTNRNTNELESSSSLSRCTFSLKGVRTGSTKTVMQLTQGAPPRYLRKSSQASSDAVWTVSATETYE